MNKQISQDDVLKAWAAGLFEGEGCVSIYQRKSGSFRLQPKITLGMTDFSAVKQFADIIGVGNISSAILPSGKTIYRWQCASWELVEYVFSLLGPWLHERRTSRFREVMAQKPLFLLKPGQCHSLKTHCAHGHEYNEQNTYNKNGHRHCRICQRFNSAKWRSKGIHNELS